MNLIPFTCPDCGRHLMLNAHQMQTKRCPECAYKAKMEKTYASRRRKHAEAQAAKTKPQKQVSNMQAISELAAAARREGLTYGQHVALQDSSE